jgi:two-component system chemotaxis sensor kinase CheA
MISLRIADDGKGIDIEKLKQKALLLGIINKDEIINLEDKDFIPLVFEDGLSGKDDVSISSGRGLGMAIIKQELEKIGGLLDIATNQGVGTEFHFLLPI